MPIPLNAEMLSCAYEYLCALPPFNKWKLPPAADVKFAVIKSKAVQARHIYHEGKHTIEFSTKYIGRHEHLIETMAHEMVHVHMHHNCLATKSPHGAAFQKFADRICKIHEFDRLNF